jgi:mannose-1-phosphate guanylyltransferase
LPVIRWHDSSKARTGGSVNQDSIRGVILAGTYPWANSAFDRLLARPLVPIAHKPLISYGLAWLRAGGISRVTVCGNRQTRSLEAELGHHIPSHMTYSYLEDPMPRGAAGCIRDAAEGGDCETYGAAVPTAVNLAELLERHATSGALATVVVSSEPGRDGTPGAVNPVGIYVLNRAALELVPPRGFFDIKEHLIPKLYRAGAMVRAHEVTEMVPRVLNAQTYLAVNAMAVESVIASNTVEPGSYRRGEALIHHDTRIAPDVVLAGPILIAQGARIDAGAVVVGPTSIGCDVVINEGAVVSRSAAWRRSIVGAGATVDLCILGDGPVLETNGHDGPEEASHASKRDRALGRYGQNVTGQ